HPVPALRCELAAAIDDGPLAQDQDIEGVGSACRRHLVTVADIDLAIGEAVQVRALDAVVGGGAGPRAPDVNRRAALPEGVGDTVADAAGAAHHQDGLAAEI